jgi:hypothetical protein
MYILQYALFVDEKERRGDYKLSPNPRVKLLCRSGYLRQVYHIITWLIFDYKKLSEVFVSYGFLWC